MKTKTINIYSFNELSEDAQQKAIDKYRNQEVDYDFVVEDAQTIFTILGYEFTDTNQPFYFSGFYSQGDGACIASAHWSYQKGCLKKIQDYAPLNYELHKIAKDLQKFASTSFYTVTASIRHSGHYYHEISMSYDLDCEKGSFDEDTFRDLTADLCKWLYNQLENEYEHQTSDEATKEWLQDQEFNEAGEVI